MFDRVALVSIIVTAVFGAASSTRRFASFWRAYLGGGARIGIVAFVGTFGALGFVGRQVASVFGFMPTNNWIVNGLIVGSGSFAVSLVALPENAFGVEMIEHALSIFSVISSWVCRSVDSKALDRIEQTLIELSQDQLVAVTHFVLYEYLERDFSCSVFQNTRRHVEGLLNTFTKGLPHEAGEARDELIMILMRAFATYRICDPPWFRILCRAT